MPTAKTSADKTTKADDEQANTDVPQEDQTPDSSSSANVSLDEIVNEILWGRYGTHDEARARLDDEGRDVSAVMTAVNQRIANGAPTAYKPTAVGLVKQVQNGEWGDSKGLRQRLTAAGFPKPAVDEVVSFVNKE